MCSSLTSINSMKQVLLDRLRGTWLLTFSIMFIIFTLSNWKDIVKKIAETIPEATVSEIKKMTMSCFCHLSSKDRSRFTLQCKGKISLSIPRRQIVEAEV